MRYLGIDFGMKRIGLAISDDAGSIAFPRETILNDEKTLEHILALIEREKVGAVVVGDTRAASGAANIASLSADLFIEELKEATPLPVHRGFEAWSSVEASRYAPKGKQHDDSAAAAIILQRFLDSHTPGVE